MTLSYLIRHRERPGLLTARWFIVWSKRALMFAPLVRVLFRKSLLEWRGARVGDLTIVSKSHFEGSLKLLALGDGVAIGRGCYFALHDRIDIGDRAVINNNVIILTASHDVRDPAWGQYSRPVKIEPYAWVATGATILPGVTVGRGAVVGAGSVVRRNVPAYAIVAGNPAQVLPETARIQNLDYLPSGLAAPFEAWLGKPR